MNNSPPENHAEADAVPMRTCVAIAVVAISISALAVSWSWSMAATRVARDTRLIIPPTVAGVLQTLVAEEGRAHCLAVRQGAQRDSYGWVDREHGIVRVPIEVGMSLYLSEEAQR